ncbi:site-specific integrase [Nannocystis sp. bb15-2]|uniref:Site-specific integrase n=1 Tax=Nannocystis bainbridge TaxID=2995303 RepID=A0ABT5DR96_9BACT|nr:site-specific integrase [Nannocystis bainbridge]
MKIKTRPYNSDPSRFQIDIRFMNPCKDNDEIRRRMVAPPGLDESQARLWGERQVPAILRELVGAVSGGGPEAAQTPKETSPPRSSLTFADFYEQRFVPEYVELQKLGTQVSYDVIYRRHFHPLLGDVPLAEIDEDRLSQLRAALLKRVARSTANMFLTKLGKILRFARKLRKLEVVPEVEKLKTSKIDTKTVYSDDELDRLLTAARALGPETELMILLALDTCLRVSEICALEWTDVDLNVGTIKVQHNVYRGHKQTPKGTIGTVALTAALRRALVEHKKREPIGPLVLYRRSQYTGGEWAPHNPRSIEYMLKQAQRSAGLLTNGPHLLRHTGLTRLANLGASVYVVQAVARHARITTTQAYLHTQQSELSRKGAALLDTAANQVVGNAVAKLAKPRKK